MKEEKAQNSKILKITQIASIALMLLLAVGLVVYIKVTGLTAKELSGYAPSNLWLAALVIIVFFVLKSFSLMFPLPILYVATGLIMPNVWQAFIVNLLGVFLSLALPFYLGRFSGRDLKNKLTQKYPKIQKLDDMKQDNEFMLVFIVKISGLLACDLSSLLLGAMGIKFKKFITGSMLGLLPMLLAVTFLSNVLDIKSPLFYLSIGGVIALMLLITLLYNKRLGKKNKAIAEPDDAQTAAEGEVSV